MSFASEIKKELTAFEVSPCCASAELAALIQMNGMVNQAKGKYSLDIQTENAAIARRIYSISKVIYDEPVELLVRKKMKLKKNNVYIVRFVKDVENFLIKLDIMDHLGQFKRSISEKYEEECCKKAYLRGAFLAGGSINNPETSSYHLEIFNFHQAHNESLCHLLNTFGLKARELERRNGYITYVKEAEKITEFLIIIGATNALFKFEDVRIVRDMRNSVNRLVNCETANLNKTIGAAFRQMASIQLIKDTVGLDALPNRLQLVAKIRLEHPEASLKELAEIIGEGKISKSGINHRLKKIDELAHKIKLGENILQ